jgi:hypothetical protein
VIDAFALADLIQDRGYVFLVFGPSENGDRFADDLVGGVSEDTLGAAIPTRDEAFERLADDSVIGRIDDGGKLIAQLMSTYCAVAECGLRNLALIGGCELVHGHLTSSREFQGW